MNKTTFEILGVNRAPERASYLAKVSFAFRPSEFGSVRITRSVKDEKGWHSYTDAEIEGARMVRVRSAFVRRSQKGELYLQQGTIDVPWETRRSVAEEAMRRLDGEGE